MLNKINHLKKQFTISTYHCLQLNKKFKKISVHFKSSQFY